MQKQVVIEVVLKGFNGGNDATDDLVMTASAPADWGSSDAIESSLRADLDAHDVLARVERLAVIEADPAVAHIDHVLPEGLKDLVVAIATIDDDLTAEQLDDRYNPEGGGEHPMHPRTDWRYEVANEDTLVGYWDWVAHKIAEDANDFSHKQESDTLNDSGASKKMIVRKITIVVRGNTEQDVEEAFNEAVDRLNNGYVCGNDRNESSGFYFENSGDVPAGEIPA